MEKFTTTHLNMNNERIWISWEDHRRSRELSSAFSAVYYPITMNSSRYIRYPFLAFRTLKLLKRTRPKLVFCQNPSMVLAILVLFLRNMFKYKVVVDRHSNFKFETKKSINPKWLIFHLLSYLTVRNADLTIITNEYLKNVCNHWGGNVFILQDKIPDLNNYQHRPAPGFMKNFDLPQVMFITTFSSDEPINEIIESTCAMSDVVCYLTGDYSKIYSEKFKENLKKYKTLLTGYISDEQYLRLMYNCDVVVVLTKKNYILNCGAYEAIAMNKPLVLSDTSTLQEYFGQDIIYADPISVESICVSVKQGISLKFTKQRKIKSLSKTLGENWNAKFFLVNEALKKII